jgi:prophage DNA circulation protein
VTFASYDEAIAVRDRFAERMAAEAETATDDDAFDALIALRLALVGDVNLRAAALVHLRTVPIPVVTSTLEIAAALYADGTREAEVEARNRPPHPGFVTGSIVVADE